MAGVDPLPDPLWADSDLRQAASAVHQAVISAFDLLEQASMGSDETLAATAMSLLASTQTASDRLRPLVPECVLARKILATPVPTWCDQTDACAMGAAFQFAAMVREAWLLPLGRRSKRLIIPAPDGCIPSGCVALVPEARKQLQVLAARNDIPTEVDVLATVDDETGAVMQARIKAKVPDAKPERDAVDEDWISASKALPQLGFIESIRKGKYKGLRKFAKDNPTKLKIRNRPKRGIDVNLADIARLTMENDRQRFDALGTPEADSVAPISEAGIERLAKTMIATRAKKARK